MAPALFTAPCDRKATTPPVVPFQGCAVMLPAAFTVTLAYSGTRITCVLVAAKAPVRGCVKWSCAFSTSTLPIRASSQRPTKPPVRTMGA
ncbi:hypothetical protein MYXA107069_26590 [Myxococcus xanthus]